MEQQIRRVVETALTAKGFEKAEAGEPGFLIEYAAGIGSGSSTVRRSFRPEDSRKDWRWTGSNTASYEKGILMLEMSDPATGRPLWRAAASAVLKEQADAAARRKGVERVLRQMLDRFPPKP
jgi:hypothetical protein